MATVHFAPYLTYSLLVVKGDIICFPSIQSVYDNKIVHCSPIGERQSPSESLLLSSFDQFVHANHVSGLFYVEKTPLPDFIRNSIGMRNSNISSFFGIQHWKIYWNQFCRWLHFSSHSKNVDEFVNSKILSYSVYRKIYHSLFRICTLIIWILSLILFLIHFSSLEISDFRMILVTFFVCPLVVTMLETFYETLYLTRARGYWTFLRVDFCYE